MNLNDIQLSGEQLTIAVLVVGLVAAAAVGPALLTPTNTSTANETETPRSGTYQTPDQSRDRTDPGLPDTLHAVPLSHTSERNISAPAEISASTGAQTMDVAATTVDGEPALQLSDNRTHSGRWVSVPTAWYEAQLGHVPETAYIDHSSGETYTTPIHARGSDATFYVEEFSTNIVTFAGEVTLSGADAGDGTTYSYDINSLNAASNFSIEATGVDSTHRDTVSSTDLSSGSTVALDIAGSTAATGANVTFIGAGSTTSASESGTGTGSVSVGGNVAPTGESVTFTGDGSTTDVSGSGAGSGSVSVGGNLEPTGETVEFTGEGTTISEDASTNGLAAGGSLSLPIDGNLDPTGPSGGEPEISITADATTGGSANGVLDDGFDTISSSSTLAEINPQRDGNIVHVRYAQPSYSGEVPDTIAIEDSSGTEIGSASVPTDSYSDLPAIVDIDADVDAGSEYTLVGYDSTGSFKADTSSSGFSGDSVTVSPPDGESEISGINSVWVDDVPTSVSVSADDGASVSIGDMSDGETVTRGLDLSSSASSITVNSDGGQFDVMVDYNDRTATQDPTLDLDGDGTAEASYPGVLADGESSGTISTDGLSIGSNSIDTTTSSGPQPSWSISWTEQTATENPSVDIDGDGTAEASYGGILTDGESSGSISTDGLSTGTNNIDTTTASGPQPGWSLSWTEQTATDSPSIDVDGDGSADESYNGVLTPGETSPAQPLPNLSTGASATVSTMSGPAGVEVGYTEHTYTQDVTVEVNADQTTHTGELSPGTTTSLTANTSWLREGTNRVNVSLTGLSADAPAPQVGIEYSHDASDEVATQYSETRWLERYNVSKTYASNRTDATLAVPFQREVIAIEAVEMRTNGGSWTSLSASEYTLDNTELTVQLGNVLAGDSVQVRANGSLARVQNGGITVTEPTMSGDLDTRFIVDSWASDSYIAVPPDGAYNHVHYVHNATWAPDDSARYQSDGTQHLRLPSMSAGEAATVSTVPVVVEPQTGDVVIEVNSTNETRPVIDVSAGQEFNDDVNFTFTNATDGATYVLYSESSGVVRDRGTANSLVTLVDNDGSETLSFRLETVGSGPGGGSGGAGGTGIISRTGGNGQFIPLIGVAILIAGLLVVSQREEPIGEGVGSGVERAVGSLPVVGGRLAGPLGSVSSSAAGLVSTVLGNRTIALGIAAALGLGAIQAGFISLPSGSLVIVTVAGVALLSFVGLRELGEFELQYWVAIVVASTVVALQVLSDESLLTAIVSSQIWPVLAIGGLYLAYRFVQGIRQPDTEQTFVIDSEGGQN